jgi:hypothetical protein
MASPAWGHWLEEAKWYRKAIGRSLKPDTLHGKDASECETEGEREENGQGGIYGGQLSRMNNASKAESTTAISDVVAA